MGLDVVSLGLAKADAARRYAPLGDGSQLLRFKKLQPTILTNFEAGHGWTVTSGVASSDLNDTTDGPFSGQSLRITTGGTGASSTLTKNGAPSIPAGRAFRLWVKVADPDTVSQIRLFASTDSAFTNYYSFQTIMSSAGTPEIQRPYKAGEWQPVLFHWSTATTVGTPDRADLTNLRILITDRNAGVIATVRLGRLEHVDYPANPGATGVVSLTYDDTFATQYTTARLHLAKYAFTATLFPIIDRIGQAGYMTQAQIDELANVHGWEVGAHATSLAKHQQALTGMTKAERKAELTALRAYQAAHSYGSPSFAYPNGYCDVASIADVFNFYSTARLAALTSDESQVPSLPMRMQAVNPGALTLAQMQAHVDRAATHKTWTIFVFHDLPAAKTDGNSVTAANHAALVDYIATSGLPVRSLNQVMRASAG